MLHQRQAFLKPQILARSPLLWPELVPDWPLCPDWPWSEEVFEVVAWPALVEVEPDVLVVLEDCPADPEEVEVFWEDMIRAVDLFWAVE